MRTFSFLALVAAVGTIGLARAATSSPADPAIVAPLWASPGDPTHRDLYGGPGGESAAPRAGETFRFVSADTSGHSNGYHVVGPEGRKWKIKTGDEVSSEIAASRLLWAIGYQQPALYFLSDWAIEGGPAVAPSPARFRLTSDHKAKEAWAFDKNPFVATRALRGLIVANVLLNNWDLDPDNNRIYRLDGRKKGEHEAYVVQDLGASFGKTRLPLGTRNKIADYESQSFVTGVEKGRPLFDYHGPHKKLLNDITVDDVTWVCGMLKQLTDRQLDDAFRAAGYSEDLRARFIRKLKSKIAQGWALGDKPEGPR